MKRDPQLINLNLENILKEAKLFKPPIEDSYIQTYPEFIKFFRNKNEITKHDLVISSHFVYGWMPTIIDLNLDNLDEVLNYLNLAKAENLLNEDQLEILKNAINNSLVGLSKLLHFINPDIYAIWDSRIYRYTTGKKSSYGIGEPKLYLNYLTKINEIKSNPVFENIHLKISNHFNYPITATRAIEILMFEADKRDHKKLIG